MRNKKLTAFSLIELSIVVLIIGLIIASVVGGKKLVTLSNLTKARQLTNSSPVNGIEDLALWLETTSKNSFTAATPTDGSSISTWYDINPQKNVKNNATAGTAPTYTASVINGLPALTFASASNQNLVGSLSLGGSEATFFVVAQRNTAVNNATTFTFYATADTGDSGSASSGNIAHEGASATVLQALRSSALSTTAATHPGNNVPYIFTTKFDGTNNTTYLNAVQQPTGSPTTAASTGTFSTGSYVIGAHYTSSAVASPYYNGNIGEIIIYNRALSDFERGQVENYLSKKWSIKLP